MGQELVRGHSLSQLQLQLHVSPSLWILQDLGRLTSDELESILEESLEDIKARGSKGSPGGNYLFTPDFSERIRLNKNQRKMLGNPKFSAKCDEHGLTLARLEDYSKLESTLAKFKNPEGKKRKSSECFTKALMEELNWIYQKQEEIAKYVLEA